MLHPESELIGCVKKLKQIERGNNVNVYLLASGAGFRRP